MALASACYTLAILNDGENGNGISSITFTYLANNSSSRPSAQDATGWTTWASQYALFGSNNRYLWQRQRTQYTGKADDFEVVLLSTYVKGDAGDDAIVLNFEMDSNSFITDHRKPDQLDNNDIELFGDIQGYDTLNRFSWTTTNPNCYFTGGTTLSPHIHIPKTVAVRVDVTFEIFDSQDSRLGFVTKYISPIDRTVYGHNYGTRTSTSNNAPNLTEDDPLPICIEGKPKDYYTNKNASDGNTYEYNGSSGWELSSDTEHLLVGLDDMLADTDVDLANYSNANSVSRFRRILAQEVIAKALKGLLLEIENTNIRGERFYAKIGKSMTDTVASFIVQYTKNNETKDILNIDVENGTASLSNAEVDGSFNAKGFSTSSANENPTTIDSYTSSGWGNLYNVHLWSQAVATAVKSNYDEQLARNFSYDVAIKVANRFFTTTYFNTDTIHTDINDYDFYPIVYVKNVSGTYLGQSFQKIAYIEQREGTPMYAEVRESVNSTALPASNILYIVHDSASYTNVKSYENDSTVTIAGTTYQPSGYFNSKMLRASDITNMSTTCKIPMNTNIRLISGSVSVNGASLGLTNLAIYLSASEISFINNSNGSTVARITVGTYGLSNTSLAITNLKIETSKDGIKTKHIIPYAHETYDIGTDTNRFERIYGNEVHGAVFN